MASRKSFTRFFCGEKKSHLINLEKSKTNNDNNKTIHIRNNGNIPCLKSKDTTYVYPFTAKVSHRQTFKLSVSKLLKNKLIAPCEGTVNKVSIEWSHHGILSTNSKVRATLLKYKCLFTLVVALFITHWFTAGCFVLISSALHAMTMKHSGYFLPQIVPSPFELVSIFYQSLLLPSLPCVPTVSKFKKDNS